MKPCRWCDAKAIDKENECFACWSLRTRIQANPAMTRKMLENLFDGKYSCYTIGGKDGK